MRESSRKYLALVLCVCLIAMPLLTALAEVRHSVNGCADEDCEVCVCLAHLITAVRLLGAALLLGLLTGACAQIGRLYTGAAAAAGPATPVALRVRLNC